MVYGYGPERFGPEDPVTREQLAVMLYRYQQYMKRDTSQRGGLSAFADGAQVGTYAREAMEWAVGTELLQGRSGGQLAPLGATSRAELCSILVRFQALKE